MITVIEFERDSPSPMKAAMVHCHNCRFSTSIKSKVEDAELRGWVVTKVREFPTRIKTGGFVRVFN
ncbi:hypothetical protein NVP1177O_05 [Vibrio phage 1.177.O._10N.286.45.E10]|nr:hypothetical protein NVP1177O_05 [Vibrio phage 1.177.O._10N.286.45.E10]